MEISYQESSNTIQQCSNGKGNKQIKQGSLWFDSIASIDTIKIKNLDPIINDCRNAPIIAILGDQYSGKQFLIQHLTRNGKNKIDSKKLGLNIFRSTNEDQGKCHYFMEITGTNEPVQLYKEFQKLKEDKKINTEKFINKQIKEEAYLNNDKEIEIESQKVKEMMNDNVNYFQDQFFGEQLLQDYVFQKAQMIFYCVGLMSREQQQKIHEISIKIKKLQDNGGQQKLYIVHSFNYLEEITIDDAIKDQVKKDILNCFDVKTMTDTKGQEQQYFQDYTYSDQNQENPIYHLYIGKHDKDQKYTKNTLDYIQTIINNQVFNKQIEAQSYIDEDFKSYLNDNLEHYIQARKIEEVQKSFSQKAIDSAKKIVPNRNFYSNENEIILQIDLPGINIEQIMKAQKEKHIKPVSDNQNNKLHFKLNIERLESCNGQKYPQQENNIQFGIIEQQFTFPVPLTDLERGKMSLKMENNVLLVTVQKKTTNQNSQQQN